MALRPVRFVGLNRDVWIPDDIQVVIDIVPSWRTNIRSNQVFTGQTKTTWHDTGNPNSNAYGERNWLHSGAGGAYVGYNFAYDAKVIIQLTPLNEITWHGGNAEGNKSWGAEQCLNTDWNGALRVGAALHGGLCAAMGWNVDTALVQHNYWWGKHCPAQIRNKGLWPTVVNMTKQAAAAAKAAAGGTQPAPTPTPSQYVQGLVPKVDGKVWDGLKTVTINNRVYHADARTVTVGGDTLNRRGDAKTSAGLTGAPLPANSQFAVLGWVEGDSVNGENRWWVTMWGSYMWSGGTVETPVEKPQFDPNTVRTIVNEKVYYPAGADRKGREVVLVEDSDLYQWASFTSAKVGAKSAGEKALATWWCRGETDDLEDIWWVLDVEGEDDINKAPRLHVTATFQRPY